MTFQQITLTVHPSQCEMLAEQLEDHGALAITYLDAEDQPVYEPALNCVKPMWEKVFLKALFENHPDLHSVVKQLHLTDAHIEQLPDKQWVRECMDQFKPMQFGENLWICPSWHEETTFPQNAVVIALDPGLAFGTGSHPTTRLCLTWLADHAKEIPHKKIIDYGSGSGILGIAAMKLGADSVSSIDIDPQALTATAENAQKNGVLLDLYSPETFKRKNLKADMILSNILAGTLSELVSVFSGLLLPQGKLVLSGLLKEQVNFIQNCYVKTGKFKFTSLSLLEHQEEEWAIMELEKLC